MDFVADALFDGRKLHALKVVDNITRERLAIDVGQSLKGEDVIRVLNDIVLRLMKRYQIAKTMAATRIFQ